MKIFVKVKPNSSVSFLEKISENEFVANVKEKAIDGKANEALVKLIAKEFGVSQKGVEIKTPKSRKKVIEINI